MRILASLSLFLSFLGTPALAADAPKTRVAILMFDGVQIIDFAAPYEVFGQADFDVFTVSEDGGPVTTAMDLAVNVDHGFADAPPADILLVPGGDVHDAMANKALLEWITKRSESSDYVFSVCTGSLILASTGLLDGYAATTFHRAFETLEHDFPEVDVIRDQRWVESGKFITSAGLASAIDTALHVFSKVKGVRAAREVAMHLEYDWSPDGGFVRGLMADQFMRSPEGGYGFPEGTMVDEVFSLGDTQYWETEYVVESPLDAKAFLALMRERARMDKALDVLPLPDPMKLAWQYESDRGGHWRASFDVTNVESANRYRVVGKVMRLD